MKPPTPEQRVLLPKPHASQRRLNELKPPAAKQRRRHERKLRALALNRFVNPARK